MQQSRVSKSVKTVNKCICKMWSVAYNLEKVYTTIPPSILFPIRLEESTPNSNFT